MQPVFDTAPVANIITAPSPVPGKAIPVSNPAPSSQSPSYTQSPSFKQVADWRSYRRLTPATAWAALAGAGGGWLGHNLSSLFLSPFFHFSLYTYSSPLEILTGQSLMGAFDCLGIAALILITTNQQSLRGSWDRDLWRGLALFVPAGLIAGFLGQLAYFFIGGTRAIPWALTGAIVGLTIGMLRRDKTQAMQGALGGIIGGLIGGALVDGFLATSYTDETFALASRIGLIITGALIGFFMRLVQDTLKTAWLVGITPGVYQNKEYPLNKNRVTVGKSELCDIALYQKSELPLQNGAFVQAGADWSWNGESVSINGVPQAQVKIVSGDVIRLGNTDFRFMLREKSK